MNISSSNNNEHVLVELNRTFKVAHLLWIEQVAYNYTLSKFLHWPSTQTMVSWCSPTVCIHVSCTHQYTNWSLCEHSVEI